jgi:hypothetical protein
MPAGNRKSSLASIIRVIFPSEAETAILIGKQGRSSVRTGAAAPGEHGANERIEIPERFGD